MIETQPSPGECGADGAVETNKNQNRKIVKHLKSVKAEEAPISIIMNAAHGIFMRSR
jgi:hypothetical protein